MINENMSLYHRHCRQCQRAIRGRIDKKFCDDYCRNSYNNKLKGMTNNLFRNINNALRKNHRILGNLLEEEAVPIAKTKKERLERLGFQFKYLTHSSSLEGKKYHYVYDHAYVPLENGWVQIERRTE